MSMSKRAQDLHHFATMRGEKGLAVAGIPDRRAVEELRANGLVRVAPNEATDPGFSSRIWVTEIPEPIHNTAARLIARPTPRKWEPTQ